MKTKFKIYIKICSVILAFSLLVCALPMEAFAAEEHLAKPPPEQSEELLPEVNGEEPTATIDDNFEDDSVIVTLLKY